MGATIKDIAARTGLGLATISKYLNGGHVLEKNQEAIERAIEELDFQVNEFARSLKTKQSKTVGIVIPQLNNLFMTSIVTKVEETLRHHGYGVIVCDTAKQKDREAEVLQFLLNKMVDGIILMATGKQAWGLEPVLKKKIPVVLIDRKVERLEGILDMVLLDNFKAAYDSTSYLLARGHRQIGILIGPEQVYTSKQRLAGYLQALQEAGIRAEASWIHRTDFSMESGYHHTVELITREKEITAIFATNFEMTLGSLLALKDQGRQVPKEISLIGFDNKELARAMQPGLTIVSQPVGEMGVKAAELLLQRMQPVQGDEEEAKMIILQASIEEGASVSMIKKEKKR